MIEGMAASLDAGPAQQRSARPPRSRQRRRQPAGAAEATGAERQQGADQRPRRENRDSSGRQGERGDRRDGGRQGPRDRHGRPGARGRDAAPGRVERKLYSTDSVVDRGFDDVEEEAGTRRVNWTIVKRTTADLISRKALSAVYVLQREGVDTEFPNLGAARSAVNKTIVHPEKLTRAKAEYAAEKK